MTELIAVTIAFFVLILILGYAQKDFKMNRRQHWTFYLFCFTVLCLTAFNIFNFILSSGRRSIDPRAYIILTIIIPLFAYGLYRIVLKIFPCKQSIL